MYVCMYMHVCMFVCMYMYVCMFVCLCEYIYACIVGMYACMYICMDVCMHVCMYVCIALSLRSRSSLHSWIREVKFSGSRRSRRSPEKEAKEAKNKGMRKRRGKEFPFSFFLIHFLFIYALLCL